MYACPPSTLFLAGYSCCKSKDSSGESCVLVPSRTGLAFAKSLLPLLNPSTLIQRPHSQGRPTTTQTLLNMSSNVLKTTTTDMPAFEKLVEVVESELKASLKA